MTVAWQDQISRPAMIQDSQERSQADTLDDAPEDVIMFTPTRSRSGRGLAGSLKPSQVFTKTVWATCLRW